MSERDENSEHEKLAEPILGAVPRRGFLKYLSAVFATAALPEALTSCVSGADTSPAIGATGEAVDFTSIPMTWVTRKDDNLSLGFQFSGIVADASHNIALASGTTAGNAYIAITFPPQHVIEDAVAAGATDTLPLNQWASGTSRLVFQVPASYGVAVDAGGLGVQAYNLQGVLQLCAQCPLVVAPNAMSNAGTNTVTIPRPLPLVQTDVQAPPRSFAKARIDRVIARVDPEAAKRVLARLTPEITIGPIITHHGTTPVEPTNGQTSIELPHRLLISPNETVGWSYAAAPVTSESNRTELWNARMGLRNPATGLADPGLGGLSVRALWTRDYDDFGGPPLSATATDPVANPLPNASDRDQIVRYTGDMSGSATPPLPVSRLMLTPLGGTLDVSATFPQGNPLVSWAQRITLGRDEYVQTVTLGVLLPFGHPAAVVKINKRCDNPANGTVGTLYNTDYVIVGQPLISYQGLPNEVDFNTFPFVAVELTQTKIPCSYQVGLASGWVVDPAGNAPWVGAIGTDHKGRAIKFTTPLVFVPGVNTPGTESSSLASGVAMWNGGGDGGPAGYNFDGQRIAFAPPPDSSAGSNGSSSFNTDSTSYETSTFAIPVKMPSVASSVPVVPWARWIIVSIDAVRHLTTSTATGTGTPSSSATFDYDQTTYAKQGFNATSNPKEVFFTLTPGANNAPSISFSSDASKSGALVTPAMAITALSRAAGPVGGSTSLFSNSFDAADFFKGFNPKLFGFVPLTSIIQTAAGCLPRIVSQQLSNAEAFLQKAMALYQTVQSIEAQVQSLATQAGTDAAAYGNLVKSGLSAAGTPLTAAESAALTAAQAAATKAQTTIQSYVATATAIGTDASTVATDITNLSWSALLGTTGMDGDFGTLLNNVTTLLNDIATLKTSSAPVNGAPLTAAQQAAASAASYLTGLGNSVTNAVNTAKSFLSGAGQLIADLGTLTQGLELPTNLSVEFTWAPQISGLEGGGLVAFVPSSAQALTLDIAVNSTAVNGQPAGANVTCRLDQFAIAFGDSIPVPNGSKTSPVFQSFAPSQYTISDATQFADVTLVFDHMQFQMLAGQKPDVDVVFSDIYFGGSLKFIETLKNLLPLDAFSDPPFIELTPSGITAGFNLAIPDIAVGMFSIENMSIDASLTMPFISTGNNGVSFQFDFCTIDNPFLVTVSMLGGGGFFGMTMDMNGLERVQFGVEVCAQLAISLLDIVSGSVSIEVGIFFVYMNPSDVVIDPATDAGVIDTVTGMPEVGQWVIGGYLRLRGELDVAGIITISIEVYLQIIYETASGKCIASGYIQIDVSLLFFSLHAKPSFSRTFAGSNGDPTFVDLMGPGAVPTVDPMLDPLTGGQVATASKVANSAWDPFADYCMAYI